MYQLNPHSPNELIALVLASAYQFVGFQPVTGAFYDVYQSSGVASSLLYMVLFPCYALLFAHLDRNREI